MNLTMKLDMSRPCAAHFCSLPLGVGMLSDLLALYRTQTQATGNLNGQVEVGQAETHLGEQGLTKSRQLVALPFPIVY